MGALLYFIPLPPLLTNLSYSRAIYDQNHQLLRLTLSEDNQYRLFTKLSDISPALKEATLLQEDRYFRWHPGINPIALLKASWQTYGLKSRRMGASTITMQVARMRYQINSKTLSGKLWQIIRALQLEMHYSKNQILEAYLNLAPYGNNIEGVGAASLIYFNQSADHVSLPEALTLVVIPQNPTKRMPDRGILKEVRNKLYKRWLKHHPEDENKQLLMSLPLQLRSVRATPFLAPHFVNEVLSTTAATSHQIITTLDLRLQKIITRVTHQYISRKKTLGVNNAAIMLIDTRTMETKALLGSADFFNTAIGGQIDGTMTKRSPGSALKPFIYALAIDQGLIHPDTVLKDVPHSFGSYNPENFDNDFVGPIKAKDALILSRNIPAIYLADKLKHPSLYEFLQQAGITNLKSESYYGLALVLGGAELSMQELMSLYSALANEGVWRPIRYTNNQLTPPGKKILSREASFLVVDMLKQSQRPDGTDATSHGEQIPIAWKTGTSSGYRDAWTIGMVGPYVLAVWIGNFNNQGNPAFIGKEIAAPLFFDIINAMNAQLGPLPEMHQYANRLHLTKVNVCKVSGMLPTKYCPDTEPVWFIPGKSPIKTDTIHREIAIDTKTGLRACQFDKNTRFDVFEFWSSDLLKIYKRAGIQRRIPPAYNTSCALNSKVGEGFSPQIVSPQTEVKYIARMGENHHTLLPLTAVVDADVSHVYWFLNEQFIGKTTRDKSILWPARPGKFIIRVVDDYGRSDAREVTVQIES
jgi:penicillin-binding protein 1C